MRFYFDHNASTPADPRVLERFLEVERMHPANPGSLHASGRRARRAVEDAIEEVATALRVARDSVYFVSGGTEANNAIVQGAGDPTRPVLLAATEHPSVFESAMERGIVPWDVDASGRAKIRHPDEAVGLICLAHGQNEVGTLQPVRAAIALGQELDVPVHVDASQTLGRCPLEDVVREADSVTFSCHKSAGLRGMTVLIDKHETRPMMRGGAQQHGRRPGTEPVGLIAASARCIALAVAEQRERYAAMRAARDAFLTELDGLEMALLTSEPALPNTCMIRFAVADGRQLLPALDIAGVEASQGSACSSGSPMPPRILSAMRLDDRAARACVRFSFSHTTTPDEATRGARVVKQVVSRMP